MSVVQASSTIMNSLEDEPQQLAVTTTDAPPPPSPAAGVTDHSPPKRRRSSISQSLRSLSIKILSIMPDSLLHHHPNDVAGAAVGSTTTGSKSLSSLDQEEQAQLNEMMQQLSPEQVEIAARSSYLHLIGQSTEKPEHHAKQFCLRYLRSKKNVEKAVIKLKETLAFRQEIKVDEIRLAFDNNITTNQQPEDVSITEDAASSLKETLRTNLSSQHLYVQGYDKYGRSTYIFVPRNVQHHDAEWTIKEHVYTLERALACSKLDANNNGGGEEPVNAVVDFTGFSTHHAPPMHIGKQFMMILRHRYVGSIHQIFLVNAPSAFWFLWSVLKHFVGKNTRDKIHFVKSNNANKSNLLLAEYYDLDQVASWMIPGGTKNREFNVDEYLLQTPFHQAFDDDDHDNDK